MEQEAVDAQEDRREYDHGVCIYNYIAVDWDTTAHITTFQLRHHPVIIMSHRTAKK